MEYNEKEKEQIINELLKLKKIKPGQPIDYAFFLEIYQPYKNKMDEKVFAEILEIRQGNFKTMKRIATKRAKILKSEQEGLPEEEKKKIIEGLLAEEKVKAGQSIDYKEFQELYEPYKDIMSEHEFAEILEIKYYSFNGVKSNGRKARVLKSKQEGLPEEEKKKIIEELLIEEKVKEGQSIDYKEFQDLYEPYKKQMSDYEFAEILGISYSNYNNIKYSGQRAKILKSKQESLPEEEKKKIIEKLSIEEKVKSGQSIDYKEFQDLYEPYKDRMKEHEFAGILEISYYNYSNMKHSGSRAKVLKSKQEGMSEEEKKKIIEELLTEEKVKEGQSIDYKEFQDLYEPYKGQMSDYEFAEILGISYSNYNNIKYSGQRAKILKSKQEGLPEEEKKKIIEELLTGEKVKVGQSIDYKEFQDLYEPYKDKMKEREFARLLGISCDNYYKFKKTGKVRVQDYYIKEKIDRIRYMLNQEPRYYKKEEIEEISEMYEIDINTIIQNILCAGKEKYVSNYTDLLEKRGEIWIGSTACSKKFANTYSKTIIEKAGEISRMLCSKYRCKHMQQDIASDTIEYILKKSGEIEKNFYDNKEIAENRICARINFYIKCKCLKSLSKSQKYDFYIRYTYKDDGKRSNIFDIGIKDETTQDIEKEILEEMEEKSKEKSKENPEEKCIELLMKNIELGLSRENALEKTGEMLNLNPEEMLEQLKTYMIKQKRAKKTKDGGYVLGE